MLHLLQKPRGKYKRKGKGTKDTYFFKIYKDSVSRIPKVPLSLIIPSYLIIPHSSKGDQDARGMQMQIYNFC